MNDTPVYSSKAGLWHLPEYRGHYFARPRAHQWGHPAMMLFLTDLSIAWSTGATTSRPFGVGDISFEDGKAPPTHHTHVWGSCVDIYVMHKTGAKRSDAQNKITFVSPEYDQQATKDLATTIVKIIKQGYQCVQFLYDDPEVQSVWPERILKSEKRPHADHFHIQLNHPNPYTGKEKAVLSTPMLVRRAGF